MPTICLMLTGPAEALYPNGGDEAYWMGQVAGALAAHLAGEGITLSWGGGARSQPGELYLVLGSQVAPLELEGQKKGPVIFCQKGRAKSKQAGEALAHHLEKIYPQPEFLALKEEENIPELEDIPGPAVLVRLLYRDNPQDEAWLARNTGAAGKALAQGIIQAVKGNLYHA